MEVTPIRQEQLMPLPDLMLASPKTKPFLLTPTRYSALPNRLETGSPSIPPIKTVPRPMSASVPKQNIGSARFAIFSNAQTSKHLPSHHISLEIRMRLKPSFKTKEICSIKTAHPVNNEKVTITKSLLTKIVCT